MKPILSPGSMPAAMKPFASATTWRWNSAAVTSSQPPSAVGSAKSGAIRGARRPGRPAGRWRSPPGRRDEGGDVDLVHGSSFGTGAGSSAVSTVTRRVPALAPGIAGTWLDSSLVHAIGIDIGGTKIAGGARHRGRRDRRRGASADPRRRPETIIDAVVDDDRAPPRGRRRSPPSASPPPASSTPRSRPSTTRRTSLAQRAAPRRPARRGFGLDITIDNDANAAGWAEFRFGAGRGVSDMTMLTIGTGVGGAIVTGGPAVPRRLRRRRRDRPHARRARTGCPAAAARAAASSSTAPAARCCAWRTRSPTSAASARPSPTRARRARRARPGTIVGDLIAAGRPGRPARPRASSAAGSARRARRSAPCSTRSSSSSAAASRSAGDLLLDPIREAYLSPPAGPRLPPRARVRDRGARQRRRASSAPPTSPASTPHDEPHRLRRIPRA